MPGSLQVRSTEPSSRVSFTSIRTPEKGKAMVLFIDFASESFPAPKSQKKTPALVGILLAPQILFSRCGEGRFYISDVLLGEAQNVGPGLTLEVYCC